MIKKYIVSYSYNENQYPVGQGELIIEEDFELRGFENGLPTKEWLENWELEFAEKMKYNKVNIWCFAWLDKDMCERRA